ncbi:MAG TPA: hypothetical protein PKC45_05740 [Gemmatales bacterium]|nr:hypothetical protein [Gemmatales bacterium]
MIRTIRPPGALMPMLVLLALWISAGLFIDRYFVGDDRLVFWNLPALPLPYLVKHQAVLFGGLALVCLFLYWLLQRSLAKRPTPPNSCSP